MRPKELEDWDADELTEIDLYLADHPEALPDHWEIGAQIACILYNANRGKSKPLKIDDFKPHKRIRRSI